MYKVITWALGLMLLVSVVLPSITTAQDDSFPPEFRYENMSDKRGKELFWLGLDDSYDFPLREKPSSKSKIVYDARALFIPVYGASKNWFKIKCRGKYVYIYHKNAASTPPFKIAKKFSKDYQVILYINKTDASGETLIVNKGDKMLHMFGGDKERISYMGAYNKSEIQRTRNLIKLLFLNLSEKEIKFYTEKVINKKERYVFNKKYKSSEGTYQFYTDYGYLTIEWKKN
ncbi:hypothetical protein SM124_13365 [Bacillus sp. 31A1R]|uniref:Uncharacterized protein n=1 Tax=Robertmurraya mangrovi TaxID=3098077 RepID=A0ABU5J042_9BACI|nr:hypothetical protein [Bacillus sp. 31A1R]MDZ5472717.1 hypothetical protein [Bacillus sp. 31A1R]